LITSRMNANAIWRSAVRSRILCARSFALPSTTSTSGVSVPAEKELTKPKPQPGTLAPDQLKYDERTHTGQAWDEEDYRLVRFTYKPKHVNPNVAMRLVNEIPAQPAKGRVVACDGGGGALGHPKIFINLDKPGNHGCGYCGLRFYKEDLAHDGSEHIQA